VGNACPCCCAPVTSWWRGVEIRRRSARLGSALAVLIRGSCAYEALRQRLKRSWNERYEGVGPVCKLSGSSFSSLRLLLSHPLQSPSLGAFLSGSQIKAQKRVAELKHRNSMLCFFFYLLSFLTFPGLCFKTNFKNYFLFTIRHVFLGT